MFQNVTSPQVRRKTAIEANLHLEGLYYISMKRLSVQPSGGKKAVECLGLLEYEAQTQQDLSTELCK